MTYTLDWTPATLRDVAPAALGGIYNAAKAWAMRVECSNTSALDGTYGEAGMAHQVQGYVQDEAARLGLDWDALMLAERIAEARLSIGQARDMLAKVTPPGARNLWHRRLRKRNASLAELEAEQAEAAAMQQAAE